MNSSSWIVRLLAWDGILPAVVCLCPYVLRMVLPDDEVVFATVFVLLPLIPFIIRIHIGTAAIDSNHCGLAVQCVQYGTFALAMIVLLLMEGMSILDAHFGARKPRRPDFSIESLMIWGGLFIVYFLLMFVSMYPGSPEDEVAETRENAT